MAQEPSSKELLEAVKQQESGGRRYKADGKTLLEGPMTKYGTAKGEMQVLDLTTKDPGFGVKPARDDSPDERARVGRDYLAAMVKRYGDRKTALVAYNWGPGNTDKWLAAGADPARLPKETQKYVASITGALGSTKVAQATETPATPAAPTPTPKSGVQRAVYKAAPLTHPLLSQLGPNYQAAMAVSMLADEGEKEGKSENEPSEAEKMLTEAAARPVALASADLGYQSPFPAVAPASSAPAREQLQAYKHGGVVHRADGSPVTGERLTPQQIEQIAADQVALNTYQAPTARPSTGMNRKSSYQSGEDTGALIQGISEFPYDLFGAPRDISNMIMAPFGYSVENPVMGSAWLKEQATKAGIRKAPPVNPTLKTFFNVGEIGAGFMNPAGVVRKGAQVTEDVVKGAKKAKDMLKQMPQTDAPAVLVTQAPPTPVPAPPPALPVQQVEPLLPPPAEIAVPQEMLPPPPAMTALPEAPPVAAPMQAGVPADRPFVGRLDAFVDTIKNPVQLGQLKGQLKGKFRDYDIERVERAFAGMDDKTKLTPDQIKQALAGVHSPGKWISETIPPKPNAHHQTVDNVWGAELGTTNLYLEQPAERLTATKLLDEGQSSIAAFIANSSKMPTVKHLEDARNLLNNPELEQIVGSYLINNLKLKFNKAEGNINKIDEMNNEILQIERGFTNPVLYVAEDGTRPWFKLQEKFAKDKLEALKQQYIQQGANPTSAYIAASDDFYSGVNGNRNHQEAGAFASKKVQEMALERARAQGVPEPDLSLINWNDPNLKPMSPATKEFEESVKNVLEPSIQTVHEASKNVQRFMDKEVTELGQKLLSAAAYRGKHKHVAAGPYPVGFTRFSEHQATVPGVGTIEGRHFHELQSDLSKDMRKSGTTHGSEQKDIKEGVALTTQIQKHRNDAFNELSRIQKDFKDGVITYDEFKPRSDKVHQKLEEQISPLEKRYSILNARVRDKAPYSLEEPFAGFETNHMVRQQLLMKNAIQAAMRDGKRFATFPGNESDKPQLYVGKVLPNLKQVIKDLGGEKSGFELRQIELPPDKHGNPITATGVVWSPEAAARIVEKGVPFAKGGMVERQVNTARYI